MKYQGRMILLFMSLLTSFIFLVIGNVVSPLFVIISLFHAAVSWFIGEWFDKYKYYSYRDPLTGVFNRRYAYKVFEKKLQQAGKQNEKVGIISIDIDYFKEMNDTYGHDYGDYILKEFCRLVEEMIRKEDILVRWGGDEFLLLLAGRDKADAEQFIEQLNEKISKRQEGEKVFLSLSIGLSVFPEDAKESSQLIAIADERMYHVKHKTKLNKGQR